MIRIHIRRSVSETHHQAVRELINKMRSVIVGSPGYVSGETLKRVDQPGEILVVSKWQSNFYWEQWYTSRERKEIQEEIDSLMETETQYEIYEYE